MSDVRTMTVETIQAGQARRYGPTEHKYRIRFTSEQDGGWTPPELTVRDVARALFGASIRDSQNTFHWWKPFFKEVVEEEPGVWYVHVYREYDD